MKILTSGRSRRASAARASTSWRERVLAVNSTTPRLMIVRCQPTQGGPSSRRSVTLGRLRIRSPEPPSPPRAGAQSGDDGTQSGCLAGGDPLGGDGIGKGGVQLVDAVTFPVEALSQVCNGRPQLLDGTFEGADGPGADNPCPFTSVSGRLRASSRETSTRTTPSLPTCRGQCLRRTRRCAEACDVPQTAASSA
jgi:hypothetical protein